MGNETIKKPTAPMDRISLQGNARERVQKWVDGLNEQVKGLRLTKTDLVNHLIMAHAESFSAEEVSKIRESYFSEVQFATWLLKEVKDAQKRGQATSIEGLLGKAKPKREPRKKPKAPQTEAASDITEAVL